MLQSLLIQNYALIEQSNIEFDSGFSVITGETGAGKSIILGAISLLLGQRADVNNITKGAKRCVIEGHFNIPADEITEFFEENDLDFDSEECIVRREMQSNGKTRAFINDTPVPLSLMRTLGEKLIDIHSQHQNLLLNKEDFQLHVVDIIAHNKKEIAAYSETYKQDTALKNALKSLIEKAEKSHNDQDYLQFQLEQLEKAELKPDEDAILVKEGDTLSHAEEIKKDLFSVIQSMDFEEGGTLQTLKQNISTFKDLIPFYPLANEWIKRIQSAYIDLKDMKQEIEKGSEDIEFNQERLDEVNDRLNLIYTLEQKHHQSNVNGLIALTENYRRKLDEITSYDDHIAALTQKSEALYQQLHKQGELLSLTRQKAAEKIEKDMCNYLLPLGMPYVQFQVKLEKRDKPEANGLDSVTFLFSANKNGDLHNLAAVASGGEIARVMLAIKAMIAGATHLPTIIFDEIDTGVSGAIAARMADIMNKMSHVMQVISITHLPQIAARGKTHYKVYKEDNETATVSHIQCLNAEERIEEIAHMLSGATLTPAAINNAKDLLK
jgi:DNA repair protein RecN (Recombination protein N)